ncbi:single-stranded DNA-binding protein [Tsukamurella soli]|uniref:Single-stranded DNA-binding protein n=1 Tax=Tsukamurella soli TaxID=644556 RepID=A0ABP8JJ15_9ACTN
MNVNNWHFSGNLTEAPTLNRTQSGKSVCNFTVAVNHQKKQGDQWVDDGSDFARVSVWGRLGENLAESLHKGDLVKVEGRLRTRTYTTRDGRDGTSLDVTADAVYPVGDFATFSITRNPKSNTGYRNDNNDGY